MARHAAEGRGEHVTVDTPATTGPRRELRSVVERIICQNAENGCTGARLVPERAAEVGGYAGSVCALL